MVVDDRSCPFPPIVAGIYENHLARRVANEVVVGASGVGYRAVVYVHIVNMGCDLHENP